MVKIYQQDSESVVVEYSKREEGTDAFELLLKTKMEQKIYGPVCMTYLPGGPNPKDTFDNRYYMGVTRGV